MFSIYEGALNICSLCKKNKMFETLRKGPCYTLSQYFWVYFCAFVTGNLLRKLTKQRSELTNIYMWGDRWTVLFGFWFEMQVALFMNWFSLFEVTWALIFLLLDSVLRSLVHTFCYINILDIDCIKLNVICYFLSLFNQAIFSWFDYNLKY